MSVGCINTIPASSESVLDKRDEQTQRDNTWPRMLCYTTATHGKYDGTVLQWCLTARFDALVLDARC